MEMVIEGQPSRKREMWDHMAREFDYTCPVCWRRPDFDDCDAFLATGYCRACQPRDLDHRIEDPIQRGGSGLMS